METGSGQPHPQPCRSARPRCAPDGRGDPRLASHRQAGVQHPRPPRFRGLSAFSDSKKPPGPRCRGFREASQQRSRPPALMSKADFNAYKKKKIIKNKPAACAARCNYYLYHKLFPVPSFFYLALFAFPGGAVGSPLLGPPGFLLAAGGHLCLAALAASPGPGYFRNGAAEPEEIVNCLPKPLPDPRRRLERLWLVTPFPPPPFPIPR